jgi:hypothetical protein
VNQVRQDDTSSWHLDWTRACGAGWLYAGCRRYCCVAAAALGVRVLVVVVVVVMMVVLGPFAGSILV